MVTFGPDMVCDWDLMTQSELNKKLESAAAFLSGPASHAGTQSSTSFPSIRNIVFGITCSLLPLHPSDNNAHYLLCQEAGQNRKIDLANI